VKPSDLLRHLDEFLGEKAALRDRHVAAARVVGQYDFNNTYQYVIAREDQHLAWLGDAIGALGGSLAERATPPPVEAAKNEEAQRRVMEEDARGLEEFASRWRPRIGPMTQARQRLMLDLILGEVLEHARLFRQGSAGRLDLLGRRTGGQRTGGRVLPTRWVE
jgi:hypothetical protein